MSTTSDRFIGQRVVLADGTVLTGKSVRVISSRRFANLGGSAPSRTIGDVRVNGKEIPVNRRRGRSGWIQAGTGSSYNASIAVGGSSYPYSW